VPFRYDSYVTILGSCTSPETLILFGLLGRGRKAWTDWHPLDGGPAPEYVPERWDGPHVGKRLVEGLCTLMLMPMPRGPRASRADLLAQQEADAEQRQRDQREANRTRVRPPHLIRSGRSEYSQSMRNARWVYQGDIGLPLRFGRFQ
jgi:hypothetical protein